MNRHVFDMRRRQALATATSALAGLWGAASPATALAQGAGSKPVRLTQLIDTSADQQELSRDYSTGLRLAFAEIAQTRGRVPSLSTAETDGTPQSVQRALRAIKDDGAQLALVGTVGERLALTSIVGARDIGLEIAHIAPWLADTRFDAQPEVFTLFASRESQIEAALRSLATSGITDMGLVYADTRTEQLLHPGIQQMAERFKIRPRRYVVPDGQDSGAFAATLPADSPVILLFLGATIELALFTQGLGKRGLQRYVVCLADVDTTTLLQLGPGKVPVIITQVVPNPQASNLEVVRRYRTLLKQLFDEAPSPVSLAGYLAGRYAAHALSRVDAAGGRAAALAELRRRPTLDLGGFAIDFSRSARGNNFVGQTMLRNDGKLIG